MVELLEAVELAAEVVADAVVEVELEGAAAAEVDVELAWPLDPHAATSSAGASAKPIRFSIGPG